MIFLLCDICNQGIFNYCSSGAFPPAGPCPSSEKNQTFCPSALGPFSTLVFFQSIQNILLNFAKQPSYHFIRDYGTVRKIYNSTKLLKPLNNIISLIRSSCFEKCGFH